MSFGTNKPSSGMDVVTDNLPTGAAVGAASYVIGYVLTFVFVVVDGVDTSGIDSWKFVGWVFYNAHNVDVESSAGGATRSTNFLSSSSGSNLTSTVPELVYMVVPILVLVAGGFLAYAIVGRRLELGAAAGVGATLALGYVVLALLGTFLFQFSQAGVSTSPPLVDSVLLVGLVYPIVFGAVGGVVGQNVSE